MIQSINLPPSAHTITSSAHCSTLQPSAASSHYIFSAHATAAITSSVHTAAMYSHVQPCIAICSQSSVYPAANCSHLQPPTLQLYLSVYTAAHCNPLQPAAITSSVHILQQPLHLQYSHVQLSAANLQCTLQPTTAIYNHLHYSYTIQCTLQLHYLMLIPYSASSKEG